MTRDEMRQHARDLVATWPPLTPEQRSRLCVLLRPDSPEEITQKSATVERGGRAA